MTTDAITPKEEGLTDRPRLGPDGGRESAPSILRDDAPATPRFLGMLGAFLVIFAGMVLALNLAGRAVPRVSTGWLIFSLSLGLCGLLFHAAFDRDVQLRRLYLLFGFATLAIGIALSLYPYPKNVGDQMAWGVPCLVVGLLFLLAFLRNEDEPRLRGLAQKVLGTAGAAMALAGLFGGNLRSEFFLPIGLIFSVVGLIYLAAFVASRGVSDDTAYYAAVGLAVAGVLVMLIALVRSLLPTAGPNKYFVDVGVMLMLIGLLYACVGAGFALDWPLFVMTRRELGAFFFSPIAYFCLIGFTMFSWFSFMVFFQRLDPAARAGDMPPIEPIVREYLFALFPVITVVFVVPVLTMRLLSEEQRSGTMEVLLTAPVDEPAIVLSKFLAALVTYITVWVPFGLFLMAIPLAGGNPFDYRPLLSFLVALVVTGAGFVSMGLFFSSLSKNQIASGVLTFSGMLALTITYWGTNWTREASWETVLRHMSYLDLWLNTLDGKIVPRFLLFWLSMTVLFLFMTVKVLESRKWR